MVSSKFFAAVLAITQVLAVALAIRNHTAEFDVLAYNDVYEMNPDQVNGFLVGGPSRVIPLAKHMRSHTPNSLVIFAGDTMSPSLWSSQFHGMQMVDAHNAIGVDYACLGNHEFDFGIEGFLNVSKASKFPWLNANCYELATKSLLRGTTPHAVRTLTHPKFGTIKIGLFGIMYDMQDSSKGLYWTDPIEAAKNVTKVLRETYKVDVVIAITHQDLEDDNRLSTDVKGIDVIYGGHEHSAMMQSNYGTPYLKADLDFRTVWRSHFEYFPAEGSNAAAVRMNHQLVPVVESMPTDAKFDKVINATAAKISTLFEQKVGKICEPLDLSQKLVRSADAPIAHIFADAQRVFYGNNTGDVVVMNGGGIRTDRTYPAGPITLGEVVGWSPFGNTVMITETDGASLKKFIIKEMLATCGNGGLIVPNGFYVHPAGVKYSLKCTGAKQAEITSLEWVNHPKFSGPVQDSDVFKLVINDFLYTSEFSVIPGIRTKPIVSAAEASRIDSALEKYFKSQPDNLVCEKGPLRSSVSF